MGLKAAGRFRSERQMRDMVVILVPIEQNYEADNEGMYGTWPGSFEANTATYYTLDHPVCKLDIDIS